MKNTKLFAVMLVASLAACGDSDDEDRTDSAATIDEGGEDDGGTTTGDDSASATQTQGPTSASEGGEGSTSGGDPFDFDDTPIDEYAQVDRMGMPAVNTAVIASKDDYNQASPAEDAKGTFVEEIVASVTFLHDALDDDLTGAGLIPCLPGDCVAQGAPLVVPDTLKIDLGGSAGFPNGRLPADPVVDVTLAVLLLDLSADGQDAATLANLPLNPPENDTPFLDAFPYFADPN